MFSEILDKAATVAETAAGTAIIGIALAEMAPLLLNILTYLLIEFGKMLLMSTVSYLVPWILVAIIIWKLGNVVCAFINNR